MKNSGLQTIKRVFFVAAVMFFATNIFAVNKKSEKNAETSTEACATTMIQGTVIDQITGEVLAGVKVLIEETNEVAYTDFDGNFIFNSVVKGEYNINVNYISYKTNRLQKVNANGTVNSLRVGLITVNE